MWHVDEHWDGWGQAQDKSVSIHGSFPISYLLTPLQVFVLFLFDLDFQFNVFAAVQEHLHTFISLQDMFGTTITAVAHGIAGHAIMAALPFQILIVVQRF